MNSEINNFISKDADVLGMVVSGSLTNGVEVKLKPERSVSEIKVGRYVSIEAQDLKFFGVVTDIELGATDQTLRVNPPEISNPFIANVISGSTAYGIIQVEPMLILSQDDLDSIYGPQPAKTIPPHFSKVSFASDGDVETVFGLESDTNFWLGNPLDMDTAKLCLNIEELIKRDDIKGTQISCMGMSYGGALMLKSSLTGPMRETPPHSMVSYGTIYDIESSLDFILSGKLSYNF